jgi:hypothetical protein
MHQLRKWIDGIKSPINFNDQRFSIGKVFGRFLVNGYLIVYNDNSNNNCNALWMHHHRCPDLLVGFWYVFKNC